ncbi:MAG: dephospho-CoA kinase [Muribaculaceae bacterium]|nr:dephospho-CoA kinase [Muribaculaceae bacterium]MDE6842932.1 dephospho-CoA kinase [Muribaculaceae bacterium]
MTGLGTRPALAGIAGGIGAGKSMVSRILRLRGYKVYDCDTGARELMDGSEEVKTTLRQWCGDEVIDTSGCIDRTRLGEVFFTDAALRSRVNALVHRLVREDVERFVMESDRAVVFVEAAVMATSGLADLCDMVLWVTAPEEVRVARAMKRDGMDRERVLARIESQRHELEALMTHSQKILEVINDDTTLLLPQITRITGSLEALAGV